MERGHGRRPAGDHAVDRCRHAPPDDRIRDARATQDLWHLGDVPEHVGKVAHVHRLTEVGGAGPSHLQVPHQRLAADEELVHQDLPWTDGEPPAGDMPLQPFRLLGADLEVVVDRRQLSVEREGEVGIRLEHLEDAVDEVDQLHPEALEGPIPLAIPMRVRDEVDDGLWGGIFVRRHLFLSVPAPGHRPPTTNDVLTGARSLRVVNARRSVRPAI